MIDDPRKPEADAPEARNREQDDEEAQAQTVAQAARHDRRQEDSDKVSGGGGGDSADVQDLVDHMRQMERSGVIDMDAYRGERSDDDKDDELGPGGVEDDEPRGAP